jgi:minor extracellular serine protease Vpr
MRLLRNIAPPAAQRMSAFTVWVSVCLVTMTGAIAQPVITSGSVIDGAGFVLGRPVAPGSVVSIFGSGLAASLMAGDTIPLSSTLNGVSVTFNGIQAPLYFVSPGQINAQMPWNMLPEGQASGQTNLVVTANGVASSPVAVPLATFAPSVFTIPPGQGFAVAINVSDGSIAAPPGAIPGLPTHAARVGDALIIYANGLGPVDTPIAPGAPANDILRNTRTVPTVLIGGQPATVLFSGLAPQFPGINQLNIVIPAVAAGNSIPLQLQVGGVTSSDKAVIAVGP